MWLLHSSRQPAGLCLSGLGAGEICDCCPLVYTNTILQKQSTTCPSSGSTVCLATISHATLENSMKSMKRCQQLFVTGMMANRSIWGIVDRWHRMPGFGPNWFETHPHEHCKHTHATSKTGWSLVKASTNLKKKTQNPIR